MAFKLFKNLVCEAEAGVIHREQETLNLQLRAQAALYYAHSVEQLRNAFESKILGLHGNNNRIGRRQRIDCDDSERGAAVNQYEVIIVSKRLKHLGKRPFTVAQVHKLHFCANKVNARAYDLKPFHTCRHNRSGSRLAVYEAFVD